MHDYDAITKRAVFRNVDKRPCSGNDVNICSLASPVGNSKVVQKASSVTVDFERVASSFHLVHLSGRYACVGIMLSPKKLFRCFVIIVTAVNLQHLRSTGSFHLTPSRNARLFPHTAGPASATCAR
jgi:hypothetical protein